MLSLLVLIGIVFLVWNGSWASEITLLKEGGRTARLYHTGHAGIWFGVLGSVLILGTLLLTVRWWLISIPGKSQSPFSGNSFFVTGICGALILAGTLSWQRMNVSVYNDEEYCLRSFIRGKYSETKDGDLQFRPVTWAETVWAAGMPNPLGNNHVLFSILSRLALDGWRLATHGNAEAFSEVIFRLPSWIAGLGAMLFGAMFLRRLGFTAAGVLFGWFLALHPWFLRYMAEGRGYALMFCFLTLGFYSLIRALESQRWRWWLLFGISQFLMLASCAAAVYVAVVQNIVTLIWLLITWRKKEVPFAGVLRLGVSGAVTACALLILKTPWLLFQIQYLLDKTKEHRVGPDYLKNFWSYVTTGMLYTSDDPGNPLHITIRHLSENGWWFADIIVWIVMPALLVGGLIRLFYSRHSFSVLTIALLLLPAPLGFLHAWITSTNLFIWYLIFALPGVAMLLSLAVTWPFDFCKSRYCNILVLLALGVVLAGYAKFTRQQSKVILSHSKEALRDAVEYTQEKGGTHALIGMFFSQGNFYDNHIRYFWSVETLADSLKEAYRKQRPFYILYGNEMPARRNLPHFFQILDDPNLFVTDKIFYGLETSITNVRILRYTGKNPASRLPNPLPQPPPRRN